MINKVKTLLARHMNEERIVLRAYLLIAVLSSVILFSMGYILWAGRHMIAHQAPMIDASMEIKLEATNAHLWFEEIISGDENEDFDVVMESIAKADWYARSMLEGGVNSEGRFSPLEDKSLHQDIIEVREKIAIFKQMTLERWNNRETAGIGSDIDQKYDIVFRDFISQADKVETNLQRALSSQLKNFQILQGALIGICFLSTIIMAGSIGKLLHRQIRDKASLDSMNQQLNASNQQLIAGEQQLRAANQQLKAHGQQLLAANQQLKASEQQLKVTNQQLQAENTERHRAEKNLTSANETLGQTVEKLARSNTELQEFVYIASHDLREPLRKITSFGGLVKESLGERLEEDDKENLEFMIDGAERMTQMIEAMLVYSQLNTKEITLSTVDLNEVIEQFGQLELATLLAETNATIEIPQSLPRVKADKILIRQLIQNIIVNGIKYQKPGIAPRIEITARQIDSDKVRIEFKDNGIGIKEEMHKAIFKMFKRVHSREEYEGAGIGLAVCKKIAERHDSRIGVDSKEGEGSVFWFTLSAATEPVAV